jgi:hypothetical protein
MDNGSGAAEPLEFKAIKLGARPRVRVDATGITYEQPNLATKLAKSRTIPRASITAVDVQTKVGNPMDAIVVRKLVVKPAVLKITSTTETIEFRTEKDVAERARAILLGAQSV